MSDRAEGRSYRKRSGSHFPQVDVSEEIWEEELFNGRTSLLGVVEYELEYLHDLKAHSKWVWENFHSSHQEINESVLQKR